jgi:hypothetical protein
MKRCHNVLRMIGMGTTGHWSGIQREKAAKPSDDTTRELPKIRNKIAAVLRNLQQLTGLTRCSQFRPGAKPEHRIRLRQHGF